LWSAADAMVEHGRCLRLSVGEGDISTFWDIDIHQDYLYGLA
jgi:hypothetical protein